MSSEMACPAGTVTLLACAGKVKVSSPVPVAALALALLLVAIVVAPYLSVAVKFGLAGIEPVATV